MENFDIKQLYGYSIEILMVKSQTTLEIQGLVGTSILQSALPRLITVLLNNIWLIIHWSNWELESLPLSFTAFSHSHGLMNYFKSKILPKKWGPQCFFLKLDFVLHHYWRASQINTKYFDQAKLGHKPRLFEHRVIKISIGFHQKVQNLLHAYSQRPNLRKSFQTGRQRRGSRISNRDTNFRHWYYSCHRNHRLQKALRASEKMDLRVVARDMEFSQTSRVKSMLPLSKDKLSPMI